MIKPGHRFLIAIIPLAILVIRIIFWNEIQEKLDEISLALLLMSLIIFLIPIENIKSLKAAGVELELSHPQIKGAIDSLNFNLIDNKKIKEYINSLSQSDIKLVNGAKVLWIDDKPQSIIGERRLFRALGIQIIASNSMESLIDIINRDNDFDLIISDIQWRNKTDPNKVSYGGIKAIEYLRQQKEFVLDSTHVNFYTAYTEQQIDKINNQTKFKSIKNSSIHHSVLSLLKASIGAIIKSRNFPIKVSPRKKPT